MKHSLLSAGSLNRMLQAADEAWHRKDFQQCIETLERASHLAPSNTGILIKLGRIYGLRYNYAAAQKCFEKAVRISSQKTETLGLVGLVCVDFARQEMAEHYFSTALGQTDVAPETLARLAELYERLRRNEDAGRLVERALHRDKNCTRALLVWARLERNAGRLEKAEEILVSLPSTTDNELKVRGFYELGALLDRQGQYDKAMTAFVEAKKLLSPDIPILITQWQATRDYWRQFQTDVTLDLFQRWSNLNLDLQPRRRLAFLGGYARSGTTLLEQVLDSHPDIVSAEETVIFHDDAYAPLRRNLPPNATMLSVLDSVGNDTLQTSRKNYFYVMEQHLAQSIGNRLLIDKNPSVNFLIPAFIRVFPEIKIIIALRDPRDVCLSCFMQAHLPLGKGSVAFTNLATTVDAYSGVMSWWKSLAPMIQNPVLEVRYEDVLDDLKSVACKTLNFLEVPWNERVLGFAEHARKKLVRSPTYADVTQPIYQRARGRWRNYKKYLEPYLDDLEPFVKAFGYE